MRPADPPLDPEISHNMKGFSTKLSLLCEAVNEETQNTFPGNQNGAAESTYCYEAEATLPLISWNRLAWLVPNTSRTAFFPKRAKTLLSWSLLL